MSAELAGSLCHHAPEAPAPVAERREAGGAEGLAGERCAEPTLGWEGMSGVGV